MLRNATGGGVQGSAQISVTKVDALILFESNFISTTKMCGGDPIFRKK